MQRINAEAQAMGEKREATGLVQRRQSLPERSVIAQGQFCLPSCMTGIDGLSYCAILQLRGLGHYHSGFTR